MGDSILVETQVDLVLLQMLVDHDYLWYKYSSN